MAEKRGEGRTEQPKATRTRAAPRKKKKPTPISKPKQNQSPKKTFKLTGPTRSGTHTAKQTRFARMQEKPSSVTIFGANHMGSNLTTAFHCFGGSSSSVNLI